MTRFLLLSFLVFSSLASPAYAQMGMEGREGEVLPSPICTFLKNRSDQTIMGTLSTLTKTDDEGNVQRFRENFRLEAGDRVQFCTSGPFFEGRRIELVLRTLLPLFTCKTQVDQEIFLDAIPDENDFKQLSATCR